MGKLYRRIMTMGMISLTALLAWVYCLLEYRSKVAYMAGTSGVLLITVYILLIGLADLRYEREKAIRDYISDSVNKGIEALNSKEGGNVNVHDVERILKAMYVQVRKINGTIATLEESQSNRTDETLDTQKKLIEDVKNSFAEDINKAVKVSLKYGKNENENIILAINDLDTRLEELVTVLNEISGKFEKIPETVSSSADADTDADADVIPFPSKPVEEKDPNAMLSQEDIEALFSSMNVGDAEEANQAIEEKTEEESSVVKVEEAEDVEASEDVEAAEDAEDEEDEEEVLDVASISDNPNKVLSPDEIAALFASMGS